MDTYNLLKNAILNKKQVTAEYKGLHREMCPHAIGWKNGKAHCLFYQFAGESSSGKIVSGSEKNWRCIPVEGLLNVVIRDGDWFSVSTHSKAQTCIDSIDAEVEI